MGQRSRCPLHKSCARVGFLEAWDSTPLPKQARRLRSQGPSGEFTKQTSRCAARAVGQAWPPAEGGGGTSGGAREGPAQNAFWNSYSLNNDNWSLVSLGSVKARDAMRRFPDAKPDGSGQCTDAAREDDLAEPMPPTYPSARSPWLPQRL